MDRFAHDLAIRWERLQHFRGHWHRHLFLHPESREVQLDMLWLATTIAMYVGFTVKVSWHIIMVSVEVLVKITIETTSQVVPPIAVACLRFIFSNEASPSSLIAFCFWAYSIAFFQRSQLAWAESRWRNFTSTFGNFSRGKSLEATLFFCWCDLTA